MALPVELIDNICTFLRPRDLAAVAAANSVFYHVAQRILYRDISVDAVSRNLPAVLTIAHNPHIARHVRTFAIRITPYSALLHPYYRALATAIHNMSELTSLEVCADQAASWVMRTPDRASHPRLHRFATNFHLDHHVAHFLNKADALLELEVDSAPTTLQLRDGALPRLSQFTGSSQAAQAVVPGRPVQHIHLSSGDLTQEVAVNLAKSSAPLQVLGAATSSHSVDLINTLTQCMAHLVHLRIVTTYNFSDAPDSTYFANIADALTSLQDLQSCEIWGLHWTSSKKSFNDETKVWQSQSFNAHSLLTEGNLLDNLLFPY